REAPVSRRAESPGSTWLYLDFVEEIRIHKLMNAFLTGIGIHQPGSSSNTTQQGIPVLRRKAEAGNLMPVAHCQRRHGDHRLVQNTAKESLITAKGENGVSHGFFV